MVQTTQYRLASDNIACWKPVAVPAQRRGSVKRVWDARTEAHVSSGVIVMRAPVLEYLSQMRLPELDHEVQALSPYRPD